VCAFDWYNQTKGIIMSGHSKWSTIKRQKGVADAKKANVFTKLANAITVAARAGSDPSMNFQLRLAIDRARVANMPKDNIERSIARGAGMGGAAAIEEVMYEAYGPGGTAILIEAATDNRNRTAADIKAALNKYNGKLATAGAVQYLFEKHGTISIGKRGIDAEAAELTIMESGAVDYEVDDDNFLIYTKPDELESVKKHLESHGLKISDAHLSWEPKQTVALDDETAAKAIKLLDALDELDDVTSVASNLG
jgi:YebC/PmpR family DNA-binding regulatory protein